MSSNLYSEQLKWKYFLIELICVPTYLFLLYALFTSPFDVAVLVIMNLVGFAILVFYLNFRILKVKVTEEYIEASYGVFSKRVSLSSIENIVVRKYRFRDVLGWGIRMNFKGELAYNIFGDDYTGVLVDYIGKNNKPKKLFISSKNPQKIVETIKSYC